MSNITANTWQLRRSSFNHRWLKNTYLISFAKWGSVVNGAVRDPGFDEGRFISNMLADWREYGSEAHVLADEYESQMSPSVLFETLPLSRSGQHTRAWLRPIIHELWKARYRVEERTKNVLDILEETESAYEAVAEQCKQATECTVAVRGKFREFWDCCRQLSQALSGLESKVRAI